MEEGGEKIFSPYAITRGKIDVKSIVYIYDGFNLSQGL